MRGLILVSHNVDSGIPLRPSFEKPILGGLGYLNIGRFGWTSRPANAVQGRAGFGRAAAATGALPKGARHRNTKRIR